MWHKTADLPWVLIGFLLLIAAAAVFDCIAFTHTGRSTWDYDGYGNLRDSAKDRNRRR